VPEAEPEGRGHRILRGIDRVELFVANAANVVILATIFWNVLSRYVLETPVAWAEDVTSIAFAWFIFIGMAAVHNRRGHIGVDLLASLLPKGAGALVDKAGELFVLVFCSYAAYLCAAQTIVSHTTSKTTVLEIPLSVLFASLTLGFSLMAVSSAFHLAGSRTESAEA
jgi:TRAP-type C4-dicarboxylate transport system permease small subunit